MAAGIGRKRYFKDLSRREYIEKAYEIIEQEGEDAVSIRRMAKEFGCSTTSMYRYFENIEELTYYANLIYLDEYLSKLEHMEKTWKNILDMHVGIWEAYADTAFRHPRAFDVIFFSRTSRHLTNAIREFYEMFPERIDIVSPYLQVMLQSTELGSRDMVMVRRCVEAGAVQEKDAELLCHMVCFLYKGYLKDILDYGIAEEEIPGRVRQFTNEIQRITELCATEKGKEMLREMENGESYIVYTRQDKRVLEAVERDGVYRVKEEFVRAKNDSISDLYIRLYTWLTEELKTRIHVPEGCRFPIWLSMHEEMRLRNTENTVCLKLRIPKDQVYVMSEYAWGYRVNQMYVPESPEDEKSFNEELVRNGIGNEAELVTGQLGNFYPLLKRKILGSFSRVFSLKPRGPFDELGVCYEIRKEWVLDVERGDEKEN